MKKWISLVLAGIMALNLTACADYVSGGGTVPGSEAVSAATEAIPETEAAKEAQALAGA